MKSSIRRAEMGVKLERVKGMPVRWRYLSRSVVAREDVLPVMWEGGSAGDGRVDEEGEKAGERSVEDGVAPGWREKAEAAGVEGQSRMSKLRRAWAISVNVGGGQYTTNQKPCETSISP